MPTAGSFSSSYFRIQALADGVYAVLGDQHGLCHSNAAIVDLGDRTLVVDTLTLPSYGDDLAEACRRLTGRNPSWVSLTHYHADHLLGNQSFPDTAPLIATPGMSDPIEEWMGQYQGAIDDPAGFMGEIHDFEAAVDAETNPLRQKSMRTDLARYRALYAELPRLRLVRPNTWFEGALALSGSRRSIELIEVAHAHTTSDVYVRLPDDGIVLMGDLGFFDTIPFLAYADPLRWIDVLKEFEASAYETFVPGHGVVGGKDTVQLERECIEAIVAAVQATVETGDEITDAVTERLPEPFQMWASRGRFNEMNYLAVAKSLEATE